MELISPHEDPETYMQRGRQRSVSYTTFAGRTLGRFQGALDMMLRDMGVSLSIPFKKMDANTLRGVLSRNYLRFITTQGELSFGQKARWLADKYHFIEVLHDVNRQCDRDYQVPQQVLIDSETDSGILRSIPSKNILLKPRGGSQGRGVRIVYRDEVKQEWDQLDHFIAQEVMDIEYDVRYAVTRTAEEKWRICYTKEIPSIVGDGESSIGRLITDNDIPYATKLKLLRKVGLTSLWNVPLSGEELDLVKTGNISQGAFPSLVEGPELRNLDRFIAVVVQDLERTCRIPNELKTYSFDLGVMDRDVVSNPDATLKELIQAITFFELQPIFGLTGYFTAISPRMLSYFKNRRRELNFWRLDARH